ISPASGLETSEFGNLGIYSVVLTSQPEETVYVSSSTLDPSEGMVTNGANLKFTVNNWNVPQHVTVTGQDDEIADGDVVYAVQVKVNSLDNQYNNMTVPPVQLTNIDDDEETQAGLGALVFSKTAGLVTSE